MPDTSPVPVDPKPEKAPTVLAGLTYGSLESLQSCLSTPGWSDKLSEQLRAGFLAERIEPIIAGTKPVFDGKNDDVAALNDHNAALKKWQRAQPAEPIAVSDAEWQACTNSLKYFGKEKKLPATIHSALLIQTFKLGGE